MPCRDTVSTFRAPETRLSQSLRGEARRARSSTQLLLRRWGKRCKHCTRAFNTSKHRQGGRISQIKTELLTYASDNAFTTARSSYTSPCDDIESRSIAMRGKLHPRSVGRGVLTLDRDPETAASR